MDSFEANKMIGAVLAALLVAFGLKIGSGMLYGSHKPEKPGFIIEIAEKADQNAQTEGGETESLGARLAKADPVKGEKIAKACLACHDFTKDGPNKTGPNLYNIVGRKHSAVAGFSYSDAFKAKANDDWSYEALDGFIKSPREAIAGTKMGFGGVKKTTDRDDLLAYLRTLSEAPIDFPKP